VSTVSLVPGAPGRVAARAGQTPVSSRRFRAERRTAWGLLSPSLLFFVIFLILPTLFAIFLSLSDWGGYDLSKIKFIGIGNYLEIFGPKSKFVTPVLVNTLVFAVIAVLLAVAGSLVVAQLIERMKAQGFWRFLYFLPVVATIVAVGNVWTILYQPAGLINSLLNALHLNSIGFLTDPKVALPSVAVVQAWSSIGTALLILTAGIKAIDQSIYEAAEIDGANSWKTFWSITLPLLRPSLLFVFITQVIGGLQSFAIIVVMTKGGPAGATTVAAYSMYQQAFKFGLWGTASAMAITLFVIIFVVTLIQLAISRHTGGDEE